MLKRNVALAVLLLPLIVGARDVAYGAEDRLLIEARINNQPVVLAFDTGAEYSVLFARLIAIGNADGTISILEFSE